MSGSQNLRLCRGVVKAPRSGENFLIYVKAPMHINSHTEFQLGFSKFIFFNSQYGQDGGTASLCQILSKSFEPRPRYASFNIMLVWLENAYSRPFLGFLGAHFSRMMSLIILTEKKDHAWAEPRHLSHKPRIFSYQFLNAHYKSPLHVFQLV